jgi:hypothetical protein
LNVKYLTGLALITLITAGLSAQTPGQKPWAILRELSGRVEVKTPGSIEWIPAEADMPVEQATLISTGFKSTSLLALGNSTIIIQPLTRLTLEQIIEQQGNEQVHVYLRTGRVRAEVRFPVRGTTDFTVRSPMATASVSGTVFDFDTVNLNVTEGRVEFTGATGSPVPVRRGETSSVNETSATVTAPREEQAAALAPVLPSGTDTEGHAPGNSASGGGTVPSNPQGILDLTVTLEGAS